MTAESYNLSGKKLTPIDLDKKVFGVKVSPTLLAQAVRIYLSNQRSASAKTKTRAEVQGSTRKIFKQKGTGRARHGSIRAPIFVGGGIAHGPDGTQNYTMKMPAKMARQALLGAMSQKAQDKLISVVKGADEASGKTRELNKLLKILVPKGKVLLVRTPAQTKFNLASRNLPQVIMASTASLNAYQAIAYPQVIFTAEALALFEKKYVA